MLLFKLSSLHSYMADGKTKIRTSKIALLGIASILAALVAINFSNIALAYTPDDLAVRYHSFEVDAAENLVLDEEGNLVPVEIDHGDNAWMLTASALVLMMTPAGLAFFYGGLSRRKNAVNSLHMVFLTTGLVGIQFVLWGYSLAFGPDAGGFGFIGTLDWVGLHNVLHDTPSDVYALTIPHQTFMIFQMMFAIITPALIVGALAERMKFSAYIIFVVVWTTFVYDFAAHWTWSLGAGGTAPGWTGALGALDFAGGTVIHITSGWSALVIALMLGRRLGYGKMPMEPHNIGMVVLGAALLWVGWFGFNAGSATDASDAATSAFVATQVATGTVAGLVAITPAAGFVSPLSAMIIGILASIVCYAAVVFKGRRKWDDALDCWAVHGMGGLAGALLTGIFSETRFSFGDVGLAFGNPAQLYENAVGAFAAVAWALGVTAVIIKVMDIVWPGGIRVTPKEEEIGLDLAQHAERAYAE